jgi:hypothetical protein
MRFEQQLLGDFGFKQPLPAAEYKCNIDGGKIRKALNEDLTGGVHIMQYKCRGACGRMLGPEWIERVWGESDPPTILVGLDLWNETEAVGSQEPPAVSQTVLSAKVTRPRQFGKLTKAVIATSVASIMLAAILDQFISTRVRQ